MDDTAKFILPDFLQGQDADSIQAGMLSALPDEFDKSEGGIVWDLTYPVALEKARAAQYLIPEALRAMFPRFARGEMLDMHAENRGMARKSATYSECVLRFTGADGAYQYALASKTGDLRELVRRLNAACHGRGGGKAGFVQGSVAASRSELEAFFASEGNGMLR